jgi:hypothetical protein
MDEPSFDDLFEAFPEINIEDVRACLDYALALTRGEAVEPKPGPQWQAQNKARHIS